MSEDELERAMEKVKNLQGEKKRLMIKAVVHYVQSMIGDA